MKRNFFLSRFLTLFIALQVLNFSIDAPDDVGYGKEEGTNDIETVIELVLENLLQMEGAIDDIEDLCAGSFSLEMEHDFFLLSIHAIHTEAPRLLTTIPYSSVISLFAPACTPERVSPPPWLA